MHTALSIRPRPGYDWIAEGLAEYYSIELLRRGKAITASRAATAFERQAEWAEDADTLCGLHSTGASTALAVTLLRTLDKEISDKSNGDLDLDALLPKLVDQAVDLGVLVKAVDELIGSSPDTLHSDNLPGCPTIENDIQET